MTFLVTLVYLAGLGIPVYLLYYFHAKSWYWHALAIAGALALGFVPTPVAWKTMAMDLIFGFVFLFLVVWGIGGLIPFKGHREKHA
jgi:hypothetical protein